MDKTAPFRARPVVKNGCTTAGVPGRSRAPGLSSRTRGRSRKPPRIGAYESRGPSKGSLGPDIQKRRVGGFHGDTCAAGKQRGEHIALEAEPVLPGKPRNRQRHPSIGKADLVIEQPGGEVRNRVIDVLVDRSARRRASVGGKKSGKSVPPPKNRTRRGVLVIITTCRFP